MACISPPELTDLQLNMALDGDVHAPIMDHLAKCPHCQQRAQRLALAQSKLKTQLFRQFCPAPDILRDYYFRLLSQEEMGTVTRHLASCPHCTRELFVDYADTMEAPALAPDTPKLFERIQLWVARLLDGGGALTPAFGLRQSGHAGDEASLVYQVGHVQISLELEPSFKNPDELMLVGLVSGVEITQMDAHLWRDATLMATTPVDSTGSFEFLHTQLAPGPWELFLSGPEVKIHIPDISFDHYQAGV